MKTDLAGIQGDFFVSAFQAWSWAEYEGMLFVAIVRLEGGGMIMYTPTGADVMGRGNLAWEAPHNADSPYR